MTNKPRWYMIVFWMAILAGLFYTLSLVLR